MVEILSFLSGGIIGIFGLYLGIKVKIQCKKGYMPKLKNNKPETQESIKLINEWLNGGNNNGTDNK